MPHTALRVRDLPKHFPKEFSEIAATKLREDKSVRAGSYCGGTILFDCSPDPTNVALDTRKASED
jgi:hypothetical protein